MSDMKCPFCQQKLRPLAIGWCCDCGLCADKELWQRLIRTRKALDAAKKALNDIQFTDDGNRIVDIRSFAHHALEQITALEQKERK